jgi:hypothetical protein
MTHLVLVVDIHGEVDQSNLENLRQHLGLRKQGRFSDDWDQEFGHRKIERADGQYTIVGLFRNSDGSWKVQVLDSEGLESKADELARLRDELVNGIEAAGLRAAVRPKRMFGTAPS